MGADTGSVALLVFSPQFPGRSPTVEIYEAPRTLAKKQSQLTMKVQETAIQMTVIAIEHQKDAIAISAITVLSTTTML